MTSALRAPIMPTPVQESALTSVAALGPPPAQPRRAFVKRHPVLTFYALAFAISWSGILLVIGGPANFPAPATRSRGGSWR